MSLLNTSSLASLWSMINQLQMYMILFLTHSFIPENIQLVIKGYKFSINIYDYIPIRKIEIFKTIFDIFDFESTNSMLDLFGINSEGTIFNLYPIVVALALIIFIHFWLFALKSLLKYWGCWRNWIYNFILNLFTKILNFMTFGLYIRNSLEIVQFILISANYELYKADTSSNYRIASLTIAGFALVLFISLVLFTLYLSLSSYKITENSHNKLGEFFLGLKQGKKFKIYTTIFLIRKGFYVIFFITLQSVNSKILIGIISFSQIVYIVYLCFLWPFVEKKWNAIEIINEIFFFLLLGSLIFLNKELDWNNTTELVYIWLIVSNSIIVGVIVAGKLNTLNIRFVMCRKMKFYMSIIK